MSRRRRQGLRGIHILISMVSFLILLLLIFLAFACYGVARPEDARVFYDKLAGRADCTILSGADVQVIEAAKAGKAKADARKREAEQAEEQAAEEDRLPEVDPSLRLENTVDFAALWEQNEDVYAWITVPGTLVDYPILQHPTDNEYYLEHTIDHVKGLPGSIYSEAIHPKDFSAVNTILYGHNMKNDTMFGSLHDYENASFFGAHPYVYIHMPDRTYLYQIFAAVIFRSVYLPDYLNYEEEADFNAYVEELKESPGYMNPDVEPSFGERLLTLHTCIGHDKNHRYLVVAVLVGEYERESE